MKEQRERDDRERLEEIESYKKENKDLKEKVNALQAELTEKEVSLHSKIYVLCHDDERKCIRITLEPFKVVKLCHFSGQLLLNFYFLRHSSQSSLMYIKYCLTFCIVVYHLRYFFLYISLHKAQIFHCCSCFHLSVRLTDFKVIVPPENNVNLSVLWMFQCFTACKLLWFLLVVFSKCCLWLNMLIFVSTLFGEGEGEQDPSDY